MLQISSSLTYTWSIGAAAGTHVSNMKINGTAVDPSAAYRITVNNFLAAGGDGFTGFTAGTDPFIGGADIDAFVGLPRSALAGGPGPTEPDHARPVARSGLGQPGRLSFVGPEIRLLWPHAQPAIVGADSPQSEETMVRSVRQRAGWPS